MTVEPLSSLWLDRVALPDADIYNEYVSFQALRGEEIVSEVTVIFSYPKYFRYEDPELRLETAGNRITVHASAYAKGVAILNENEDLILSDNYFDMNAGSKTVEILDGEPTGLHAVSVFDIH